MNVVEAAARLESAFASGRLAQAYVVKTGQPDEAVRLVRRFLQGVFCEAERKPCGSCGACRRVETGGHPDLQWIEPQKRSRIIGIEQIRDLTKTVFRSSYSGGWKACVLVAADRLGAQAANAFLKTLEEPPPRSVFFLITDSPQALLATILSRCQPILLGGEAHEAPDELRAAVTAILATGRSGDVLSRIAIGDQLSKMLKEIKKSIEAAEKDAAAARGEEVNDDVLDARASARFREVRTAMMRVILSWQRDVLLLASGVTGGLANEPHAADLRALAARGDYAAALLNLRIVEEMNRQLERNMPDGQVLPLGFSRMK